jgi:hypothetical protein
MAVLSVLPDEDSLVVPLLTELRNCSVSGDHAVFEDTSGDPMVTSNGNHSSMLNNTVMASNPMVSGPSPLSSDSMVSHYSMGSPNLVVGGPVLQLSDCVVSPNLMWLSDLSGGSPSF